MPTIRERGHARTEAIKAMTSAEHLHAAALLMAEAEGADVNEAAVHATLATAHLMWAQIKANAPK